MKKANKKDDDELRDEYKRSDFGELVRGKYAARIAEETNVVVLDPEVVMEFPIGVTPKSGTVTVSVHANVEVPPGTLHNIMKQSGLKKER